MATPESPATARNPALSAEEIGKRFLELLEGLESREDLSLERVQNVLRVTLKRFRDPQHLFSLRSYTAETCDVIRWSRRATG